MHHTKHKAFTLVELIVVVTILAILATIGFVSYSSYLTGVRDTNRLAQLVSIHDGLTLYSTSKDLPLPDESVDVIIGSNPIAYQGFAGSNTLETIDFTKGGKDPKDGQYFTYYLTKDRKYFQLMGFLEEEASVVSSDFISSTYAVDYSNRIPTVYGKSLGVLTNSAKTPIQVLGDDLDISTTTDTYIAYLKDDSVLEGDNSVLSILGNPNNSCRTLKLLGRSKGDGLYDINLGTEDITRVYCDMSTDGGGWTLVATIFPRITVPYIAERVGDLPNPNDSQMRKFSDSFIQSILMEGESTTRTQWWHTSINSGAVWGTGNLKNRSTLWNLFENPENWNSTSASSGQRFKRKIGGEENWGDWLTSGSIGSCSHAVGGWSNYYQQSCSQSWFAGCEGGPAFNHSCANGVDRAEKLLIWAR